MTDSSPNPAGVPAIDDGLRPTLDRIAAALEKGNELAEKKGGQGKGEQEKEGGDGAGGDDDKKKADQQKDGKDKKEGGAKKFFLSPLGIILTLVILAILVFAGIILWHYESTHESTDDAYTAGHVHQISPRVDGLVIEVWVDDNQAVQSGDLLVKLDPSDYNVALQRAQANLDQSKAQAVEAQTAIVQAQAGYDQALAQISQARAATTQQKALFEVAGINYARNKSLSTKDARAVAQAEVDTTQSNLAASQGGLEAAEANVQAAEASAEADKATIESRRADLVVAQAAIETNQANVDNAKLQLSYCWVLAPCAGRVSRKTVETGQRLSPGQSIMAVTENDVWVLANFKETQLSRIRVGQRCQLPVDAFKGHPFTGRVDSIQNGSGATYSLLPPDNATGNFTKIVQRVPVKLTFDRDSIKGFEDLVVPGLSVVPVIDLATTSDRGDHVSKNNPAPPKESGRQ
jgi:membrane fusion protein (multidrug efflux system)